MGPECGAAEEIRCEQDDELRRAQRLRERHSAGAGSPDGRTVRFQAPRPAHQQRDLIMIAATTRATICIDVRQSWCETSQGGASGDMAIGAMPMPAETSDTARLRWVSNQPVTAGHHRREDRSRGGADHQPEDELKCDQRCRQTSCAPDLPRARPTRSAPPAAAPAGPTRCPRSCW